MQDIRETLTRFPSESLGGNGRHFLESRLHDDALAYAVIQVMRPSDRSDPAHFDGAASLLHAGLTVWGSSLAPSTLGIFARQGTRSCTCPRSRQSLCTGAAIARRACT